MGGGRAGGEGSSMMGGLNPELMMRMAAMGGMAAGGAAGMDGMFSGMGGDGGKI